MVQRKLSRGIGRYDTYRLGLSRDGDGPRKEETALGPPTQSRRGSRDIILAKLLAIRIEDKKKVHLLPCDYT